MSLSQGAARAAAASLAILSLATIGDVALAAPAPPPTMLVLPLGDEQRHMNDLITALKSGFAEAVASADKARYGALLLPHQLTNDRRTVAVLTSPGLQYTLRRGDDRELLDRLGRVARVSQKVGPVTALVEATLSIAPAGAESGIEMQLRVFEIGRAGRELRQEKVVNARGLVAMRTRMHAAGRGLALQEQQGERPILAARVSAAAVRVGTPVTLDVGDTHDPEHDAFDFAWCQASGPRGADALGANRQWVRNQRVLAFAPAREGHYTFLLWAGEVLREEREPPCVVDSPNVARVDVTALPYSFTVTAGGGATLLSVGDDGAHLGAARFGVHWLVRPQLGLRAAVDLVEVRRTVSSTAEDGTSAAFIGALSAGVGWDLRLGGDVTLRPYAQLVWQLPTGGAGGGGIAPGLGSELVFGLPRPWAAVVALDGVWGTGLRAAAGLAYRF